ncbi:MAG: alpha/beta fold hydrolase [Ruminococcaceae bacterium]|nr:alpha/beta fold hydrolase [Oscillospiraceae bacterium]MBE6707219.1 alpha/beta fold hydrolase [Oscillospiraceae bacterium]
MATKYPIILAHGVAAKQVRILNAFGQIGKKLEEEGHKVYIADTDGFGSIENNAAQLKRFAERVMAECGVKKVNIIAHSKGGLDSKYMITELGMEDSVASLTTLCTPHKGSIIASWIWRLPNWLKRWFAFWINSFYKIVLRDEHPDAMTACDQLRAVDESEETLQFSYKVYCQSYSSTIEKARDCFIMALPMKFQKHFENLESDGLVTEESTKFGNYRGKCLDIPVSHVQIIDIFSKKSQKEKIYEFYRQVCRELADMGF